MCRIRSTLFYCVLPEFRPRCSPPVSPPTPCSWLLHCATSRVACCLLFSEAPRHVHPACLEDTENAASASTSEIGSGTHGASVRTSHRRRLSRAKRASELLSRGRPKGGRLSCERAKRAWHDNPACSLPREATFGPRKQPRGCDGAPQAASARSWQGGSRVRSGGRRVRSTRHERSKYEARGARLRVWQGRPW
jgi:hypothetical protein